MTEKQSKPKSEAEQSLANGDTTDLPKCGIVMPISPLDGCNEAHWSDVLQIVMDAISDAGFKGDLVSNADDVGIIQKRIIQNLYNNPVVVCDVSGKNPNVMFELGIRLAFDKPTLIIKDDKTSYSFDTAPIEHLEYPRDLRFSKIIDFKRTLADKITNTFNKATKDQSYTTFLKNFGEFKVAKLDKIDATQIEIIADELREIKAEIRQIKSAQSGHQMDLANLYPSHGSRLRMSGDKKEIDKAIEWLSSIEQIRGKFNINFSENKNGVTYYSIKCIDSATTRYINDLLVGTFNLDIKVQF